MKDRCYYLGMVIIFGFFLIAGIMTFLVNATMGNIGLMLIGLFTSLFHIYTYSNTLIDYKDFKKGIKREKIGWI